MRRSLLRRRWTGPPRCFEVYRNRALSTLPHDVKSFKVIESEMNSRAAAKEPVPLSVPRLLRQHLERREHELKPLAFHTQPKVGDLLLVNMNPVVVTHLPCGPGGKLGVATATNTDVEVSLSSIDARLGCLIPPQIHFLGDNGELGPATHAVVARFLRRIYIQSTDLTVRLMPSLRDELYSLGHRSIAVTLPFTQFVKQVVQRAKLLNVDDSVLTEEQIYAVRLGLENYRLVYKYLLDFEYFGRYSITVIPHDIEQEHVGMLHTAAHTKEAENTLLKAYALKDLPGVELEARTLEIVRDRLPDRDQLGPAEAAELVFSNNDSWPRIERLRYKWFTQNPSPSIPITGTDRLESVRTEWRTTVYCIDPENVREVDDGISWTPFDAGSPDSGTLGIHVADFASFTDIDALIKRISSVPITTHFTNKAYSMLPQNIIKQFELKPGRPCISVLVDVDLSRGKVGTPRVAAHVLGNVVQKTYAEVDAEDRHNWRHIIGATKLFRRERQGFVLRDSGTSWSADMIAECMIKACSSIGALGAQNNLPLLYRTQRVFFWSEQDANEFNLAARSGPLLFKWRDSVRKSVSSTTPGPHEGLGVPAYAQFTSPLRRGEDALAHLQIGSLLLGEKPKVPHSKLQELRDGVQVGVEIAKEAMRAEKRYESLQKLAESLPTSTIRGIVSGVDNETGLATEVWLPDYDLLATIAEPVDITIDTEAWFCIQRVVPVGNLLVVTLA